MRKTLEYVNAVHITSISPILDQKSLKDADELKQEGNEHFRAQQWNDALVAYQSGLRRLPARKDANPKGKSKVDPPDVADAATSTQASPPEDEPSKSSQLALSPIELECAKARAILNANIGACFMKRVCLHSVCTRGRR